MAHPFSVRVITSAPLFLRVAWQELERRFSVWMDNLKYVLDYNAQHSNHWVGEGDSDGVVNDASWAGRDEWSE